MTRNAARANPHLAPASGGPKVPRDSWSTIVSLLPYLWPKHALGLRVRLVLAVISMLLGIAATVYLPIPYIHAVNSLSGKAGPLAGAAAIIVAYALVRVASAAFGELRDGIFAKVQMRASREVARQTFEHLHGLSMRFHMDRQTGGLSTSSCAGHWAFRPCCGW